MLHSNAERKYCNFIVQMNHGISFDFDKLPSAYEKSIRSIHLSSLPTFLLHFPDSAGHSVAFVG